MRKVALTVVAGLLAFASFAAFPALAQAQHRHQHRQLHNYLDFRDYQRDLYHHDAHRYPMTYWQHERLHNNLDWQAYRDHRYHQHYHQQQYYYAPSYPGGYSNYPSAPSFNFGYRSPNFSIRLGW